MAVRSVSVWPTIVSGNLKIGAKFLLPFLPPILISPSILACLFRVRGLNFYRVQDAENYGSRYSAVDHISIFTDLYGLVLHICIFFFCHAIGLPQISASEREH